MSRPLTSVALCTYNGARFLRQQLDSIAEQTCPPDEVIIRDDRSSDDTVQIAEHWATQVPFQVRVETNAVNLGSSRNFAQAISAAQGDIILLSDQDDVWLPQKLERIVAFLQARPATEAVFTDGWVVDQTLRRQELLSVHQGFHAGRLRRAIVRRQMVTALSERAMATGATMALRATLRARVLPLPEPLPFNLIHDGWIALVAALHGSLEFIDEPLILYRQHVGQQVGLAPTHRQPGRPRWQSGSARQQILDANAEADALLTDILHCRFPNLTNQLRPLQQRWQHQLARRNLPTFRPRRLGPVLREWLGGRYHRFAQGTKTALADLLT